MDFGACVCCACRVRSQTEYKLCKRAASSHRISIREQKTTRDDKCDFDATKSKFRIMLAMHAVYMHTWLQRWLFTWKMRLFSYAKHNDIIWYEYSFLLAFHISDFSPPLIMNKTLAWSEWKDNWINPPCFGHHFVSMVHKNCMLCPCNYVDDTEHFFIVPFSSALDKICDALIACQMKFYHVNY